MDEPTAVAYPTITVNGIKYPVKMNNVAFYRLEKSGISLSAAIKNMQTGNLPIAMCYDMLAACVGNGFTGERLAELIDVGPATTILIDAMGKVQPSEEIKLQEPTAPVYRPQ